MPIPLETSFLIVDDFTSVIDITTKALLSEGFTGKIHSATNVKDAFEILSKNKGTADEVKLIICDMIMPGLSGFDFLELIRQDGNFKNIPFLMLTSENDRSMVLKCIKAGASNYLLKPWKRNILMEKLNYCWDKHKNPENLENSPDPSEELGDDS